MANPNINTLTDVFLPDGFGAFGFGDGGYGGSSELLNPQWNTNSGTYGVDVTNNLAYVEATSPPSYVGAAMYNMEYTSFFAKIQPITSGNGTIQTALIIKQDAHNYVEMSLGPDGVFHGYVSNDLNITLCAPGMPAYDPIAHAYWRIRNTDKTVFHFDTSPDGVTWTELGSVPYTWDASAVVVTIFAGFTGVEAPGQRAYISYVNLPGNTLQLSSTGGSTASADGLATLTSPNSLSGSASGSANTQGSTKVVLALPQGGITDLAWTDNAQTIDPMMLTSWNSFATANMFSSNPITWTRGVYPWTAPVAYRDGSYWPQASYAMTRFRVSAVPNSNPTYMTCAQLEEGKGLDNLLTENASIYTNSAPYGPSTTFGTSSVVIATNPVYTGYHSVAITSANTPVTLANGDKGYFPVPEMGGLFKLRKDSLGSPEGTFGTVYLSTQRANTKWCAGFIYYDSNFNIVSTDSTYGYVGDLKYQTHPGNGVWQASTLYHAPAAPGITYVAVVPIVVNNSSVVETVYMGSNTLTTGVPYSEPASNYSDPRTTTINVKADRVNYVVNSGFNTSSAQWAVDNRGTSGTSTNVLNYDSAVGRSSVGSIRMDTPTLSGFTGGSTAQVGLSTRGHLISSGSGRFPVVSGLKKGHTYTISMWVLRSANCPNIYMNFADSNGLGPADIDINSTTALYPDRVGGNWIRLQTTYTLPQKSTEDFAFYVYAKWPDIINTPFSFWIDDILVEETTTYNGYFDGGFASTDYQWESGGTANLCRSYYYKGYGDKLNHLQTALNTVMPIGETFTLLFAQSIT